MQVSKIVVQVYYLQNHTIIQWNYDGFVDIEYPDIYYIITDIYIIIYKYTYLSTLESWTHVNLWISSSAAFSTFSRNKTEKNTWRDVLHTAQHQQHFLMVGCFFSSQFHLKQCFIFNYTCTDGILLIYDENNNVF